MDTTSAVTDGDGLIFHYRAGLYSGDPVHDLASARGHEWLATCVPVTLSATRQAYGFSGRRP